LIGCRPVINLTSTEFRRVEVHDTTLDIRLVPTFVKIQTHDTTSHLENTYAFSDASWSMGVLTHSLGIKPVAVPVVVPVTTIYKDKTITVNVLTKEQSAIIKEYPKVIKERDGLKKDFAALKTSNKSKTGTIWKLIGMLSISVVLLFRKPLWILLQKLIKPI